MNLNSIKEKIRTGRPLRVLAVLFVVYLIYLFFLGFRGKTSDQFQIQSMDSDTPPEKHPTQQGKKETVIINASFDNQGFPIKPSKAGFPGENGLLVGQSEIQKLIKEKYSNNPPDQILKDFENQFGRYWRNPKNPDFLAKSQEMGAKLTETADRNRKLVQSVVSFLNSDAGKQVSTVLKENLGKAAQSPARETLNSAFSEWKSGNLDRAFQLLKQAEALDPNSPYIQIIAHQGMAFLNMEKHGPLEETISQYRDLADEANKYIKSFKPALEKAGFDPVKLYGRDPFDAKGLPTREQFEKAMDNSSYIQFERQYYKTHSKSLARPINTFKPETIEYLRKRQRGGER